MSVPNERAKDSLLALEDLQVALDLPSGEVRAVDGVDLRLSRGQTLCLVGESGCGKSLTALAILGLLPRGVARVAGGTIRWRGRDITHLPPRAMRQIRGREIGLVFQEPQSALNPVLRVGAQIEEAVRAHGGATRREARARALALLEEVDIADAASRLNAYPHELSGGMRQRVCIAIALAQEPALLIADEPTTALDVTVQAQVLRVLNELQQRRGMALLLITHDLGLVAQMGDAVAVMYAGRIVEQAPVGALFAQPRHPYTEALLRSLPDRQPPREGESPRRLQAIDGAVPSPGRHPSGCRFRDRCPRADERCAREEPTLATAPGATPGQTVACHHAGEATAR